MSEVWRVYRMSNWYHSLIPLLLGHVFFFVLYLQIPTSFELAYCIVLFLISAFGFAGFGFLVNDFFDKESDFLAGKPNRLQETKLSHVVCYLLLSLMIAIFPWFFLPVSTTTISLIIAQFILYLLYSLPFLRFKARPFISNVIDAGYAYLIPFLLTANVMSLFSNQIIDVYVYLGFSVMLLLVGFTNLLIHQWFDREFDVASSIRSTPIWIGPIRTEKLMHFLIVLIVIFILSNFLMLSVTDPQWWSVVFVFVFLINEMVQTYSSSKDNSIQREINAGFRLNQFFQFYLPVVCLILLAYSSPIWLGILFLFVRFSQKKWPLRQRLKPFSPIFPALVFGLRKLKSITSFLINRFVYWAFRVVGIDLIHEKKSAIQFLKEKWIH
ncbi:MAG: hypothetical protein E6Q37_06590 [Crocinitomicaceae bacterium]|nr:MAG: hypothetical protein E6Q37_06590 [Crocinitomicaceae bacterium]